MRLVCLAENTSIGEPIRAEHGLSLYIEANGRRLLFDMGQSALFAENAVLLDVDLAAVDTAILSHGHYDHGGGLATFLAQNDHAPVYLSRYAFDPHFHGDRYIGLDTALASCERLRLTDDVCDLGDGLTLYANALVVGSLAHGSAGLTADIDGVRCNEDYRHEQYLLIEEQDKRVLISGCSHRGIVEIVSYFKPDVLIGGFHLSALNPQQAVAEYAEALNRQPTTYYTCHCTGTAQYDALSAHIPRLAYLAGGQQLTL